MINGLRVPFLVLHGDVDGLCNIEGSRLLKRDALVEDKELIEFSGKEKALRKGLTRRINAKLLNQYFPPKFIKLFQTKIGAAHQLFLELPHVRSVTVQECVKWIDNRISAPAI